MRAFFLVLIIFLAVGLRFFDLGVIPVGFHRDEANFGFNAFSLLSTGRDLTGNVYPLHIASFLYSPAGYAYLTIPFIAFFGLTEFAVRFASALFGTATVLLTYFLVKELFGDRKLALIASLFLTISPWHINLSRVATENVIVVFFITFAIFAYFKWIKKDKLSFLLISFLCFGITLLLYQAPRAFLPLFIPLLFFIFPPKPFKKKIIIPLILFVITIIFPVLLILSSHDLTQRIRMLSIFQNPATQLTLDEQIREDRGNGTVLTRVFHNKLINYAQTFSANYFQHWSYDFLFTDKGLPDRYRIPQMGLLYFFDLPFLLFGLWKLFYHYKKQGVFLTAWVLLAPLGSALTFDDIPNLQRTLLMFPAIIIIISYGFLQIWQIISKTKLRLFAQSIVVGIIVYGLIYYLHQYYIHQINHRPWYRQEGYKELLQELHIRQANYKEIVITDGETDPVIFFLFYNQYSPSLIQQQLKNHATTSEALVLGKYHFFPQSCPLRFNGKVDPKTKKLLVTGKPGVLYVNSGNCKNLEKSSKIISEIRRSDGTIVFSLQVVEQ